MKLSNHILRKPLYVAFGQALAGGGITSVDLVVVRDASTVTMTASDGSAAPIAGADAITAGVMTAADKTKLDDLSTASAKDLPTRLDVAAATIDAAITYVRTAGYGAAGDGGGALYRRVGTQPSHNLTVQSADTAWWEIVPDPGGINVLQAGAIADDTTDSASAFQDCVDFFYYTDNPTWIKPGGRVIVPAGEYYLGSKIELKHTVILEGHGVGAGGVRSGSKLRWPADMDGIVINRYNTLADDTEGTATGAADGSIIRNLYLAGGGGTFGTADGVWFRARGTLEHCTIAGFSGHGIKIVAASNTPGPVDGNANNWRVNNCRCENNKNCGMFVDGPDVNAGLATLLDCSQNGRWGIWDSGFLGNTYIACHVASNGFGQIAGNGATSSIVWLGGSRYYANVAATEADLVATTPGTDETVWTFYQTAGETGGQIPTWLPAQPVGTYFHGGPYRTDNLNARHILLGCYSEGGGGPSQFITPTLLLGGLHGANIAGTGMAQFGSDYSLGVPNFINKDTTFGMKLKINNTKETPLWVEIDGEVSHQLFQWQDIPKVMALGMTQNAANTTAMYMLSANTTYTFGRSAAPNSGAYFPNGIYMGNSIRARYMATVDTKPTTGDTATGDIFWNNVLNGGGVLGWVGVTQGSPGTLRALWQVPTLDSAMSLPQIAVASLPAAAAANLDHVVYCTDGDAGAPCLAVSDGTNWLRIALGAAVSAV